MDPRIAGNAKMAHGKNFDAAHASSGTSCAEAAAKTTASKPNIPSRSAPSRLETGIERRCRRVRRPFEAEVTTKRRGFVIGPENAALLQDRNDPVDERI